MKFIKLLLPMLCGLCFFCYSTVGGAFTVAADSDISVTLTPEQTLALFGSSFTGTYYDSSAEQFFTMYFDCIGLSTGLVPRTQGGGQNMKMFFDVSGYNYPLTSAETNTRTCLVYKASLYSATSNGGSQSSPNLSIPLSVSVPACFGYDQKIFYGQKQRQYGPYSSCQLLGNGLSQTFYNSNTGTPYYYSRLGLTPIIPSDDYSQLDINDCAQVSVFNLNIPAQENSFDLSSISLQLNYLDWTYRIDEQSAPWAYYVFIECPVIGGYVPPETTVPTSGTSVTTSQGFTGVTVSFPPQQTVNLSDIESGVATMVQEQWDTNYLLRLQIDQLNTIIQQLNSIYAKMLEDGSIALDLVSADPARRFNTDILDQVQNASTSYTVAQLPQDYAGNGSAGIGAFIARVVGVDPVFMTIGIFSIGFAIFCWFIFRGRGGV